MPWILRNAHFCSQSHSLRVRHESNPTIRNVENIREHMDDQWAHMCSATCTMPSVWNILLLLFLANSCSSFKLIKWPLQVIISPPLCSHSFNINLYCACIIPFYNYLSVYLIPIQKTRIIPFLSVTPHFPAPCQAAVNARYILEIWMNELMNEPVKMGYMRVCPGKQKSKEYWLSHESLAEVWVTS